MFALRRPERCITLIQNQFDISENEFVIVETVRGIEYGKVVITKKQVDENDVVLPLKKVIRIANENDRTIVEENKHAAKRGISSLSAKGSRT